MKAKKKNLTHAEIAKNLGVSRSYISRLSRFGMPTSSVEEAHEWIISRSKEMGTDASDDDHLSLEAKREKAISCSSIKGAMPLCREAEAIRGQIERTRTAISESRARYHASLEEIRDDRIDRIRCLCTSRGTAGMHAGIKLLNDVCMDFRQTDKSDRAARDAAYDRCWTTLGAVADAIAPE
jgi:transcriptional regulator with XRE-family HTH domain